MSNNQNETIKINQDLKTQLSNVLSLVDQSIFNRYNSKHNKSQSYIITQNKHNNSFQSQLYHLQNQIKQLNEKISSTLKITQLNTKEAQLKDYQNVLNYLITENGTLGVINSNQKKSIEEIQNSETTQAHKSNLVIKSKYLRDEIHMLKNYLTSSSNKMKGQMKEMEFIQARIALLKENIEYSKKLNNVNTIDILNRKGEEKKMEKEDKTREIIDHRASYLNEMTTIQKVIMKLEEEISLLQAQIKHKDDVMKINQLKVRELKKIEMTNRRKERLMLKMDEMYQGKHTIGNNNSNSTKMLLLKKRSPLDNNSITMNVNTNNSNNIHMPMLTDNVQFNQNNQMHTSAHHSSDVMIQIQTLRKDIENVLNADIDLRYQSLTPKERENFWQEIDEMKGNNNIQYDTFEKANLPYANKQTDDDSINENIINNDNKEIYDKMNNQNPNKVEYLGVDSDNQRKPFGAFKFPKDINAYENH